jgi:hypothetical protein
MHLVGASLVRCAEADGRLAGDERRLVGNLGEFNGLGNGVLVMTSTAMVFQPEAAKRAGWSVLSESVTGPSIEMLLSSQNTISLFSFR